MPRHATAHHRHAATYLTACLSATLELQKSATVELGFCNWLFESLNCRVFTTILFFLESTVKEPRLCKTPRNEIKLLCRGRTLPAKDCLNYWRLLNYFFPKFWKGREKMRQKNPCILRCHFILLINWKRNWNKVLIFVSILKLRHKT